MHYAVIIVERAIFEHTNSKQMFLLVMHKRLYTAAALYPYYNRKPLRSGVIAHGKVRILCFSTYARDYVFRRENGVAYVYYINIIIFGQDGSHVMYVSHNVACVRTSVRYRGATVKIDFYSDCDCIIIRCAVVSHDVQ